MNQYNKKIIDKVVAFADSKLSQKEIEKVIKLINVLMSKPLIIEKNNTSRNRNDNYNIGSYYISKAKETYSVQTNISQKAFNEIMTKKEKEILEIIRKEGLNDSESVFYFLLYNNLLRKKRNGFKSLEDYTLK